MFANVFNRPENCVQKSQKSLRKSEISFSRSQRIKDRLELLFQSFSLPFQLAIKQRIACLLIHLPRIPIDRF